LNKFANLLLVCVALFFTILSGRIVPQKYFEPYNLALDSIWHKEATDQEYMVDINNDSAPESILHHKINQSGHSIEFRHNNTLHEIYIFRENEFFISRFLHFADINQNQTREIIFFSAIGNTAYLNVLEYDPEKQLLFPIEKVKIDSIRYYDGVPDVTNHCLIATQSGIYFDLLAGYCIQPRAVYKYDFRNKSLVKTKRSSIVSPKLDLINFDGKEFLLAKNVKATGNTVSPEESESLKNSKNADTLEMYEYTKHLVYRYGDFASYILLYNKNLEFAFKPIEFFGWTNYTKSGFINMGGISYIVALANTKEGDKSSKVIIICDLQGNIAKQIPMPGDFTDVFTNSDDIVFSGNNTLYRFSKNLELVKEIPNVSFAGGFFDINRDNEKEFVAFEKDNLIVFTGGFRRKTMFKIAQEFAPFPQENGISTLQRNRKSCFFFNTRLFYYLFSYSQNYYAFLKYPFYVLLFAFWLGILFLTVKLNSRRLEKEKLRLEGIVAGRTSELKEKNLELAVQKAEIQEQAIELSRQNKHLEELDQFKRMLTSTLVHDLKNPLGQILTTSNNKTVIGLAGRMLLLITNMLDVDKYEHAKFKINKEMHPLRAIIGEAVGTHEISLREKNLKVIIRMDDVSVWADKEVLVRVFENLLSNAIRFSPQNQLIEIDAAYTENETVKISIKNCGENIPDEALKSIFDKYTQAHETGSSGYKSTGLGLTFCKMALQAHGHAIAAENFEGGVMLTFSLDGQATSPQKQCNTIAYSPVVLSSHEKEMLKPWFDRLKAFEIYQVSDISEILEQIPDSSENIIAVKQQMIDAVFASNAALFSRLIR
jgi:signal transduction histidine kinase